MSYRKIVTSWCTVLILAAGFAFYGIAGGQAQTPAKPQAKAAQLAKLDLNKATVEQLSKCPGLTPALAKAILDYREKSGPFKTPADLLKVKGMTKELLNRLNPKLEKDILYITPDSRSSEEDEEEPSLKPSKC
jgi:competence ComEA-like helix-hairpin-helix protein